MADFAMPAALELEASRRNGIPAFRREVVHNTTTQNEYRPGELCYIPMDTGAAGAFMDVSCTRLEFVVEVRNKNYFTDFINLPRCGWHAIIQEFAIELNNGLHELNRHYAECIELDMIKRGENRTPFEMVRSNPWRAGDGTAGKTHINFIKPSMVTHMGLPHCVKYAPLETLSAQTTPDIISQSYLLWSQPFLHEMFGRKEATNIAANQKIIEDLNIVLMPNTLNGMAHWDDRLHRDPDSGNTQLVTTDAVSADGTFGSVQEVQGGDTAWRNVENYRKYYGIPGGNKLRRLSKMPTSDEALADVSMYSLAYGQTAGCYSSGIWPAKQPTKLDVLQKEYESLIRFVNTDNVVNYYANVKNIPVGIPVDLQGDDTGETPVWGDGVKSKAAIGQYGHTTEFHVSLKVYSSLIGLLADRWFPELVVPQGRMRVRLRFQEPNIVFQTLMDPCRRVPGTSRDFIPYTGVCTTVTGLTGSTTNSDLGHIGTSTNIQTLAAGIHPIMVSNYKAGEVFIDSIAMGKYAIPVLQMRSLHPGFGVGSGVWKGEFENVIDQYVIYEPLNVVPGAATAQGTTAWSLSRIEFEAEDVMQRLQYLEVAFKKSLYELSRNMEYGCPPNASVRTGDILTYARGTAAAMPQNLIPSTVEQFSYYEFPTDWSNRYTRGYNQETGTAQPKVWTKPKYSPDGTVLAANTEPPFVSAPNADEYQHHSTWNPFCLPTPQYVPMRNPWDKSLTRFIDENDYVDESYICFGSYLESSVAQVRRSHSALFPLNVPDTITSGLNERLTYIVKNVQIVTQQIVLPRGTALSIVENALDGGITMECRAWKEMESMLPQAESQKHLINMAAAFATDITFLFRPVSTYQGDRSYGYNSFSFYNPFTAFSFATEVTPDSVYNSLGGTPIYYNECVVSTRVPFDIQLQISSELLPRTPIDTINSLIRNVRWGDQVFSDRDYMELNPHLLPSYLTSKGMAINTLQDGFWACFVPIECLNDQTITDNPFFVPLELSLRKKIRGARAIGGALPFLKPLDGTFHLSFNFETYMGQSDRIRTGIPIVNNNMFLKMEKCHLARTEQTQLLTICNCDGKIVFERGGTMQFFT